MTKNKNIIIGLITGLAAFHFQVSIATAEATSSHIPINNPQAKRLLAPYEKLVRENPAEAERIKNLAIHQKFSRDFKKTDIQQFAAQIYRPEMTQMALIEYYKEQQRREKLETATKPKLKQLEDLEPEQQLAIKWYLKRSYDSYGYAIPTPKSELPDFNAREFHRNLGALLKAIDEIEWKPNESLFNKWHGKDVIGEAHKRRIKARAHTFYAPLNTIGAYGTHEDMDDAGQRARLSYLASLPTPVNNPSFEEWKRYHLRRGLEQVEPLVKEYQAVLSNPSYRAALSNPVFFFKLFGTDEENHNASGCGWVKGDYAPFATPYCDLNGNKLPFSAKKLDPPL